MSSGHGPLWSHRSQAEYIVREHANRALHLLIKNSPNLALQLGEEPQHQGSQVFQSVLRTGHRQLTMEFVLGWVFLVALLKGNFWRTRSIEDVSGYG